MFTKLDATGNELPDSAQSWSMVRDNVTGLIWEGKTDDGSIHDKDNQYNWNDAQSVFIAGLNAEKFGGYSDWRLPTIKELAFIVDFGRYMPAINTNYFPNTVSSFYWSSTIYAGNTNGAWGMDFYYGFGDYNGKSHAYWMRAVRGRRSEFCKANNVQRDGDLCNCGSGQSVATCTANSSYCG